MADNEVVQQNVRRAHYRIRLRSGLRPRPTFYRFINHHKNKVRVYWLISSRRRKMFSLLDINEFLDVNTYTGHGWMFEDDTTGLNLHVNRRCILSSNKVLQKEPPTRIVYKILEPVRTLKSLCINAIIETGIEVNQVQSLCIPIYDKVILEAAILKYICYKQHPKDCKSCPLFLQAIHFYHSKRNCPYGFSNYAAVQQNYLKHVKR